MVIIYVQGLCVKKRENRIAKIAKTDDLLPAGKKCSFGKLIWMIGVQAKYATFHTFPLHTSISTLKHFWKLFTRFVCKDPITLLNLSKVQHKICMCESLLSDCWMPMYTIKYNIRARWLNSTTSQYQQVVVLTHVLFTNIVNVRKLQSYSTLSGTQRYMYPNHIHWRFVNNSDFLSTVVL